MRLKTVKEKIGVFVENDVCDECDWFAQPLSLLPRVVCPDCGGRISRAVGRFTVRETRLFLLGLTKREFIAFTKRVSKPAVLKSVLPPPRKL